MKKIYFGMAVITALTMSFSINAIAAKSSSVRVKADKASISYTYSPDSKEEASVDATKLFANRGKAKVEEVISDTFVITSKSEDGDKTEVLLRLSVEEVPEGVTYSPLDYYSFVIKDSKGVIYDSAEAELSDITDTQKDIVFGVFNTHFEDDTKTYTVEYKISEDGAKNLASSTADAVKFELVSREYVESDAAQTETPAVTAPTAKPKFDIETAATASPETVTATPDPAATATPDPNATAAPDAAASEAPTAAPSEKKLICGKDITPGRYIIKGNGVVKVESEMGELKSETTLTDGTIEDVDGSESAVITLKEGDIVTLLPLKGQEKASVSLEKTNTGSSTTSKTGTASKTGSSSGTSSSSKNNTSSNKTTSASSKTNPKTGDDGMPISVSLTIMGISVAGIVSLEVVKKKRVK